MKDVHIIIPARLASTRLPRKMLADVDGEPLIVRTYQSAVSAGYSDVTVACDCEEIKTAVEKVGGRAVLTDSELPSGTDRVFSAAKKLGIKKDSIIVNLQGDHPYLNGQFISEPVNLLINGEADIATPIVKINDTSYERQSVVKVAATFFSEKYSHVHYFSRAKIPNNGPFYQHVGVYVYNMETLEKFVSCHQSVLEKSEKLEQLRAIENGMTIDAVLINSELPISVDTKEDLDMATSFIKNFKKVAGVCLLSSALSACAPLIVCSGAGLAGVSFRNKEGITGTINDNVIHTAALNRLAAKRLGNKTETVVKHGRVLVLGYVTSEKEKTEAIEEVKGIKGVKEVIDEIKLGYAQTMETAAKDSWITSRIKTAMTTDGNIHSLNYNITTYNGVVYILGFAESKLEFDALINIARSTSCVNKVVHYIDIRR